MVLNNSLTGWHLAIVSSQKSTSTFNDAIRGMYAL